MMKMQERQKRFEKVNDVQLHEMSCSVAFLKVLRTKLLYSVSPDIGLDEQ